MGDHVKNAVTFTGTKEDLQSLRGHIEEVLHQAGLFDVDVLENFMEDPQAKLGYIFITVGMPPLELMAQLQGLIQESAVEHRWRFITTVCR